MTRAGTLPEALSGTRAERRVHDLPDHTVCDMYSPAGAAIYHDFVANDTSEVAEVLRITRPTSGPILELAAGSGRLTLPLIALGRRVIAVDLSAPMLALLSETVSKMPPKLASVCAVVHADMTQYRTSEPVGAVVIGTTSVSLLTQPERQKMLACSLQNLAPGGSLILTTSEIAASAASTHERELFVRGASGNTYEVFDIPDADLRGRHTVAISITPKRTTVCYSYIRVVPVTELVADIEKAGLRVTSARQMPGERYRGVTIHAIKEL